MSLISGHFLAPNHGDGLMVFVSADFAELWISFLERDEERKWEVFFGH